MTDAAPARGEPVGATTRPSLGLLAVLGVVFGLSVTVGNTIGSGILRTPGLVAQLLPTPWLFIGVWILGALYAALGANALAELATMMPESGGYTVYLRRSLGPYAGFVIGWSDWLSCCSSAALAALVIGEYVTILGGISKGFTSTIASAVILAFALIQWRGVKTGSFTQNLTAFLKTMAFAVLIGACFVLGRGLGAGGSAKPPVGFAFLAAFVLAMQAVIFTYDGYNGIVYFSGELRDPARDVPRSTADTDRQQLDVRPNVVRPGDGSDAGAAGELGDDHLRPVGVPRLHAGGRAEQGVRRAARSRIASASLAFCLPQTM